MAAKMVIVDVDFIIVLIIDDRIGGG